MLATKILNGIWPSPIQRRSLSKASDTAFLEFPPVGPARQTPGDRMAWPIRSDHWVGAQVDFSPFA